MLTEGIIFTAFTLDVMESHAREHLKQHFAMSQGSLPAGVEKPVSCGTYVEDDCQSGHAIDPLLLVMFRT